MISKEGNEEPLLIYTVSAFPAYLPAYLRSHLRYLVPETEYFFRSWIFFSIMEDHPLMSGLPDHRRRRRSK
jgi:hypothetical protein